jgi:hypothetical protein
MTPAGIEPATFQFVAHCATAVPGYNNVVWLKWNKALFICTFRIHNFGLEYQKTEAHAEIRRCIFDEMEDSGILELCSPYSTEKKSLLKNLIWIQMDLWCAKYFNNTYA